MLRSFAEWARGRGYGVIDNKEVSFAFHMAAQVFAEQAKLAGYHVDIKEVESLFHGTQYRVYESIAEWPQFLPFILDEEAPFPGGFK